MYLLDRTVDAISIVSSSALPNCPRSCASWCGGAASTGNCFRRRSAISSGRMSPTRSCCRCATVPILRSDCDEYLVLYCTHPRPIVRISVCRRRYTIVPICQRPTSPLRQPPASLPPLLSAAPQQQPQRPGEPTIVAPFHNGSRTASPTHSSHGQGARRSTVLWCRLSR